MSTIRERQADQSHMLVGRTRAERLLDGIYQRQKRHLLQRRRREAAEAARRIVLPEEKRRRLLDVLPEPAAASRGEAPAAAAGQRQKLVKQQARGVCTAAKEKNVEDAVEALQRHLWRHAKFDKAVQLLQQLWQSHFVPETKRCLLCGLLTAASTDNCISSPSGRTEVISFFRNVVEPILQRERERRKQAELKQQQERFERTTLRAIQLNDRLQSVVVNERRAAARASNNAALHPPHGCAATAAAVVGGRGGRAAGGEHVLSSPGGTDAGTRATMAAVAAAAAAAVDREQQKQLEQSGSGGARRGGLATRREREGSTADREGGISSRSTDSSSTLTSAAAAAEWRAASGSPRAIRTTESTGREENSLLSRSECKQSEEVMLDDAEKELLEVLQLRCKTHILLFTDDAFQFNQQVAELRRVFDTILQDMEEEEEEGLSDEEEQDESGGPREATEGSTGDGVHNAHALSEDENQKLRKESRSSNAPPAEGAEALSTPATENVEPSTAEVAQQQNLDEGEDGKWETEQQRNRAPLSSSGLSKDRGKREREEDVASKARAEANGAAGTPSAAARAFPSTSGRHTFAAGAEKRGDVTAHREEAAAGDVVGGKAQEHAATASSACHAIVENQNGERTPSAAASLSPEEARSSTGQHALDDIEEGEEMPTPEERWPLPLKKRELRNLLRCFFMDCLASLFSYRNMTWARAAIEQLFQHVYLNRSVFNKSDSGQIGLWQAQLKSSGKISANISALRIGEAPVPVQDGRDERITTIHGSMVWSSKQMGS